MAINITFQFCYESFSELLWTGWKCIILVAKSSLAQICCKILTGFRLGTSQSWVCVFVCDVIVCVCVCVTRVVYQTIFCTLTLKVLPGYLLIHYWASCPAIFLKHAGSTQHDVSHGGAEASCRSFACKAHCACLVHRHPGSARCT